LPLTHMSGPAITAHGSLDLQQKIQIWFTCGLLVAKTRKHPITLTDENGSFCHLRWASTGNALHYYYFSGNDGPGAEDRLLPSWTTCSNVSISALASSSSSS
jgi:hypothetical protein